MGGEAAEEARGGDLSPLALRHSWYRIMTPRRVKPSPIMPRTIRIGAGSLRALIERQSFHLIPACSHSALVVGISAATTGVANATARLRATIEAMIFIPRHRRLGLFSLAGTGRALCFNASLNVRGRWCLASKSVNASSASCCKLLPLSLESSSSACKVSGSKPISLRAMKHYSRNGRAPTEADQEEAPAWGGPGLGFLE